MEAGATKPARKQVKERVPFEPFNQRPRFQRIASKHRCNPKTDSGSTAADDDVANFCLRFTRGYCHEGAQCLYLHRLPTKQDEDRFATSSEDLYGRPRRDEGASVRSGSHRTLYVDFTGASPLSAPDLRPILERNFREWGPLESVRLVKEKAIAFVKYQLFVSACFAKEAMHRQHLIGSSLGEVLLIRWAKEDMSAAAQEREARDQERALAAAYAEAVNEQDPQLKRRKLDALHAASITAVDASRPLYQPDYSEGASNGHCGDRRDDAPNWYDYQTDQLLHGPPQAYYVTESDNDSESGEAALQRKSEGAALQSGAVLQRHPVGNRGSEEEEGDGVDVTGGDGGGREFQAGDFGEQREYLGYDVARGDEEDEEGPAWGQTTGWDVEQEADWQQTAWDTVQPAVAGHGNSNSLAAVAADQVQGDWGAGTAEVPRAAVGNDMEGRSLAADTGVPVSQRALDMTHRQPQRDSLELRDGGQLDGAVQNNVLTMLSGYSSDDGTEG